MRHGLADAKRIANRQDDVADLGAVAVAERHRRELRALRIDAQQREIEPRVGEHQFRRKLAPVGERDEDLVGPGNDVVVGDDQPVGGDDDARAERLLDARRLRRAAEEALEEWVAHHRRARTVDARRIDVDHRRRGALDHRAVALEERAAVDRHDARVGGRRRGRLRHRFAGVGPGVDSERQRDPPPRGSRRRPPPFRICASARPPASPARALAEQR